MPRRLDIPIPSAAPVQLHFAAVVKLQRGHPCPLHTHEALELVYYVEGTGTSQVDTLRHPVQRGVFTLIPAGVLHDQTNPTAVTTICLGLIGSGLERHTGAWKDPDGLLRRACERLVHELSDRRPGFRRVADGLTLEIVGLTERAVAAANPAGPDKDKIVDKALELIEECEGQLSVSDLADELYVSRDYLRHLFRSQGKESPIRRIIHARIEKAKGLLVEPTLSIKEVAERSGCETVYYFSRLFKKETGQTPTAFRARAQS
ncbi:MAG: hypothetical protein A3K19_19345 [Lentisphaerae bacterium RIFOXYB12_FULL_65_16]|nr:MAG: hypothetical protein A3K18_01125 [Lentisphaerae bacterium RIFOXYA12_64_32]OGV84643.1 MAG: hypothetical protein A3K19_19345 [Lentisphaerae bacterium RIFOXYB12_FULL_65_16]